MTFLLREAFPIIRIVQADRLHLHIWMDLFIPRAFVTVQSWTRFGFALIPLE